MSYFNNQILKILNEAPSYDEMAEIYNISEAILKKAHEIGLTFTTPTSDTHHSYMINQFRDAIAQQLKSGKDIDMKQLSTFFKETTALTKGEHINFNKMSDGDIDKLQSARSFLNNTKNMLSSIKGTFSDKFKHVVPLVSRFGLRYNP